MATQRASQVRVHLKTTDNDIKLPQDTGPILVSTEFRRYQLSTLVNRLLDTEKPIPLEFLINGEFLRTSLDDFLNKHGISAETTLSVEYVKALVPPVHVASYKHDAWISSVDVLSNSSNATQWSKGSNVQSRILSGSFDGLLSVWNLNSEVVASCQGSTSPVYSAKFLSPTQIVSGSADHTVRLWKYNDPGVGPGSLSPSLELKGHDQPVNGLAVHAPSSRILSASGDKRIGVWTSKKSEAPPAPEPTVQHPNKRIKVSRPTVPQWGALAMLEGHSDQVKDVCFDEKDASVAYSASMDHSVKTWDLPTGVAVDTKTVEHTLLCICHLPEQSLLATGTALRTIEMVDPRADASRASVMTLRGHKNMVRSLARDPNSNYQVISGSYDSTCRIWDIRSVRNDVSKRVSECVYTIARESTKDQKIEQGNEMMVFSVCWDRDVGIVSGGRDQVVQINNGSP